MADPIVTSNHTVSFWDGESNENEQIRATWDHQVSGLNWSMLNINKKESCEFLLQDQSYVVIHNQSETATASLQGLLVPPKRSISLFLPKGLHELLLDQTNTHKVRLAICEGV